MLLHIVADYGHGDLAFAEVIQRIKLHLPDAEVISTPVPKFSTLAAGFCVAQLGLNEAPPGAIIYHNVAPREDLEDAREDNAGERLAFARLPTGVRVIGVNAGHAFSFVRDAAEEMRWAAVPAEGSQFRSRDLFPKAAGAIALGKPEALADEIKRGEIPEIPLSRVAYIDGYGNIKTTVKALRENARSGQRLSVRIGATEREAIISDGTFAVKQGQLAFAPGSSGWRSEGGEEVTWMELFLRGGSASDEFGAPSVGDELVVTGAVWTRT